MDEFSFNCHWSLQTTHANEELFPFQQEINYLDHGYTANNGMGMLTHNVRHQYSALSFLYGVQLRLVRPSWSLTHQFLNLWFVIKG